MRIGGFREIRTREKIERNLSFDPDKRIVPSQTQQNAHSDEQPFDPDKRWEPPKNIGLPAEEEHWEPPKDIGLPAEEEHWEPPKDIGF